jgi:hypothetical protein
VTFFRCCCRLCLKQSRGLSSVSSLELALCVKKGSTSTSVYTHSKGNIGRWCKTTNSQTPLKSSSELSRRIKLLTILTCQVTCHYKSKIIHSPHPPNKSHRSKSQDALLPQSLSDHGQVTLLLLSDLPAQAQRPPMAPSRDPRSP